MIKTNSSDAPPPDGNDNGDARAHRLDWLATRAAETLHFTGESARNFRRNARIVFSPQEAASGTVLAPAQAQRQQLWRSGSEIGLFFIGAGFAALYILTRPMDWASAIILLFLVGWFIVIAYLVHFLRWRTGLATVMAAMPPPGAAISADAKALTVNGIVVPWSEITLDALALRQVMPLWGSASVSNVVDYVDQFTLNVGGKILILDRGLLSNGQVLLDTICDKLDISGRARPLAGGDVNPQRLTLYADWAGAAGMPLEGAAMTTFDKREEGFEKKFAHDEDLKFKAMARRNKLLGLWAAGQLGKSGADADAYAKEVVLADFEEAGDNDVLRKVAKDLSGKGITEPQIRAKMDELLGQAIEQIQKSG
jgi:hypothetical protein